MKNYQLILLFIAAIIGGYLLSKLARRNRNGKKISTDTPRTSTL